MPTTSTPRWKPEQNKFYYFVRFTIGCVRWDNDGLDEIYFNEGNVFPSSRRAQAALRRVKKALKGE